MTCASTTHTMGHNIPRCSLPTMASHQIDDAVHPGQLSRRAGRSTMGACATPVFTSVTWLGSPPIGRALAASECVTKQWDVVPVSSYPGAAAAGCMACTRACLSGQLCIVFYLLGYLARAALGLDRHRRYCRHGRG